MIARTAPSRPLAAWRRSLTEAVTRPAELLGELGLDPALLPAAMAAGRDFPLRVPRSFLARIRPGDPHDPLLLQVLPIAAELVPAAGFGRDPVGDLETSPAPGLLHKYRGRVLLVATGACAVHCRYCFRRHFPYAEHQPWGESWEKALAYVAADPTIEEVILSGGDPLALSDDKLADLETRIAAIPHVARLRLHTRLPVVLPERVDDALLGWLGATRLERVVVIHANHPREIDTEVAAALGRLAAAGCTLLNQSVLLRGINDDPATLAALSRALFKAGVLPYYLHLLDRVEGAAHFEVPESEARRLHRELRERLPGYLVPKLVRELAGAPSKVGIPS